MRIRPPRQSPNQAPAQSPSPARCQLTSHHNFQILGLSRRPPLSHRITLGQSQRRQRTALQTQARGPSEHGHAREPKPSIPIQTNPQKTPRPPPKANPLLHQGSPRIRQVITRTNLSKRKLPIPSSQPRRRIARLRRTRNCRHQARKSRNQALPSARGEDVQRLFRQSR